MELVWISVGMLIAGTIFGFFVGHYHAGTQWKALIAQITPGIKHDLTTAEADILATFRKWTKKDAPAEVAPNPAP